MSNPPNYEYNGSDRDSSIIPTPPPGLPTDDDDIHVIPLHADEADDLFPTHDNLNTLYSPAIQNNRWSTMSRGSAVSHVDVGQYDPTGVPSAMQNRRWSAMSRGSAVSHVDIGHFDPAGVEELRRSLQNSPPPAVQHVKLEPGAELTRQISAKSEVTLTPGDGPIDFEKTLRTIMKR
jgi:ATP-binding cassette subfamily G (WHITE) protein 2 (SNQ2)